MAPESSWFVWFETHEYMAEWFSGIGTFVAAGIALWLGLAHRRHGVKIAVDVKRGGFVTLRVTNRGSIMARVASIKLRWQKKCVEDMSENKGLSPPIPCVIDPHESVDFEFETERGGGEQASFFLQNLAWEYKNGCNLQQFKLHVTLASGHVIECKIPSEMYKLVNDYNNKEKLRLEREQLEAQGKNIQ